MIDRQAETLLAVYKTLCAIKPVIIPQIKSFIRSCMKVN